MVQLIDSISAVADQFDAIVLDQWGVLHDGSAPYPSALETLASLRDCKLGVLSNSGKRAMPNAARISGMGFDIARIDTIMTSGEALWRLFSKQTGTPRAVFPIQGKDGDAAAWAQGLTLTIVDEIAQGEAILLMGLPDGSASDTYDPVLASGLDRELPLYCSNPDLTSPRGSGAYVMSPGALAARYRDMGGEVHLFGKPHLPVFDAMQAALGCPPDKILMVGDSLHHDIHGANAAGWASLLIRAGVHAPYIGANVAHDIATLSARAGTAPPTYSLSDLR